MKCVQTSSHDWTNYATVADFPLSSQAAIAVHGTVLKKESPKREPTHKVLPQTLERYTEAKDTSSRSTPTRWDFRV